MTLHPEVQGLQPPQGEEGIEGTLDASDGVLQIGEPVHETAVVRRHHERAVQVEWPADRLRDLDRPDEYESMRRELAGAGAGDLP